jgi:hypothetical protein
MAGRTKATRNAFPAGNRSSEDIAIRKHALLPLAFLCLSAAALPENGPLPEKRPDTAPAEQPATLGEKQMPGKDAEGKNADEAEPLQLQPIEKEDPAAHARCTAALTTLDVTFRELTPIDDGEGCGIDRPLEVTTIGNGVALLPPAIMRCQAAVNLARWTRDVVVPMLKKAQPAERLAAVDQASAYICRKRNGTGSGKISEHARGTAIDISGFAFQSGRTFTIAPREEEPTLNGAFQRSIAAAACLYFSTVLDPGSDAAHETHLHLDTLKRKGGYRYCW